MIISEEVQRDLESLRLLYTGLLEALDESEKIFVAICQMADNFINEKYDVETEEDFNSNQNFINAYYQGLMQSTLNRVKAYFLGGDPVTRVFNPRLFKKESDSIADAALEFFKSNVENMIKDTEKKIIKH